MKHVLLIVIAIALFMGCKKEEQTPEDNSFGNSGHQILVSNQGNFGSGTGTISRINLSNGENGHELFQAANDFPLGNVVNATYVYNDKVYAMINNAQKIEVAQYPGFTSTATIDGLGEPRYMVAHNGVGYVSDWVLEGLHVIDLSSNSVTTTISTGAGPEQMLIHGDELYVANSGGGGTDNRVSVIDLSTQTLITQIEVGDNPNSIVLGNDGNLHVLCFGISDWNNAENDTPGSLVTINPDNHSVISELAFESTNQHPSFLVSDASGNQFYYLLNGSIFNVEANAEALPNEPLVQGNFYGLAYHLLAQSILAADPLDYQSDGKVFVYDLEGTEQAEFSVGMIPQHILPL